MQIRPMTPEEYPLLEDFLYLAIFVPEGEDPPPRSILENPELRVYLEGFGESPHDRCLAAEEDGRVVGAVWTRIMDDYGHVDNETPSFAISLLPESRGRGIGTALMGAMLTQLKEAGYRQASLAVQKRNYAVKMYRAAGFETVGENDQEYIMVCHLGERQYMNIDRATIETRFAAWAKKLRIAPAWDVKLEWVEDPAWRKTGDIKIDCDGKNAVVLLNAASPKQENLEEVLVHELFHLKLYPLDQTTESLIHSTFEEGTPAYNFAMRQFFVTLEQTVEELTKCFLLEFGEDRELSFGRCKKMKSFDELYNGLKNLK